MTKRWRRFATEIVIDTKKGFLAEIGYADKEGYRTILTSENEFFTASYCGGGKVTVLQDDAEALKVRIQSESTYFSAESEIVLNDAGLIRRQSYRVKESFNGWIYPHFACEDKVAKYTYPMRVYDQPICEVGSLRNDYLWALPLPAHLWYGQEYVAVYCLDRSEGNGTCDFRITDKKPQLGIYYPDKAVQKMGESPFGDGRRPEDRKFEKGEEINFSEYIAFAPLSSRKNPILQSEKLAAKYLLRKKYPEKDYTVTADLIAQYYQENGLWNPDAFGKGKGWYRNMWKRTMGKNPEKDFYYDLGWGEGYGAITLSALVRYSVRTKRELFREKIEKITRNIPMFLRDESKTGAYYDRFIPRGNPTLLGKYPEYEKCDFFGFRRIWTHSLSMIGYQLAALYLDVDDYDEELRKLWKKTATDIADFLLEKQHADGDINDGFTENDEECNLKRHRIPARALACGLFVKVYRISGDEKYLRAACGLMEASAPEIEEYAFYNQMLDTHFHERGEKGFESGKDESVEVYDAENACYAFLGLAELYEVSPEEKTLRLCEKCAAYFISWMFYYDLETGVNGRARGATTCRMPDFPLLYVGAGNFAYSAMKKLAALTGEHFYKEIAEEMLRCASDFQLSAPGKPWNNGIVHAVYQVNGRHWGPDIEGQMDSGMTSGSTLICLEEYIKEKNHDKER